MKLPSFWTSMPYVLGIVFCATGILHVVQTSAFTQIVPPALPNPVLLVQISGVAEICGGVGMLVPALRRVAGIGLIALLLAVFPANIYMAVDAARFAAVGPAWVFWLRLPLQFLLIWFVVRSALMPHRSEVHRSH
jgi:uncharacterized membrane protein